MKSKKKIETKMFKPVIEKFSNWENKREIFRIKTFTIDLSVFHHEVSIVMGEEARKLYNKWYPNDELSDAGASTYDHNESITILFPGKIYNEYIAHEALHATQIILKHIKYKNDEIIDEIPAYITGHIVGEIHKILKQEKIKIITSDCKK